MIRLERPELLVDAAVLAALERALDGGVADTPVALTIFAPAAPHAWVSGGLNAFVRSIEGFRVHAETVATLKRATDASSALVEHLREARGRVDVLGVSEGDVFFASTPALELHGTLTDALLLWPAARMLVRAGTRVTTAAVRERLATGREVWSVPDDAVGVGADLSAIAACIAGYAAVDRIDGARVVGLRLGSADPADTSPIAEEAWTTEIAPLGAALPDALAPSLPSGVAACLPPSVTVGSGARQVYRVIDLDGRATEDVVGLRPLAIPEGGRVILERYADRGCACRPLPDPARAALLLERASAELGGLIDLLEGRRAHPVSGV